MSEDTIENDSDENKNKGEGAGFEKKAFDVSSSASETSPDSPQYDNSSRQSVSEPFEVLKRLDKETDPIEKQYLVEQ